MTKKELSYSEAIREMEEILSQIENEELDVDEVSIKVRRVATLIRHCKTRLHKTEEEVEQILKEMEE